MVYSSTGEEKPDDYSNLPKELEMQQEICCFKNSHWGRGENFLNAGMFIKFQNLFKRATVETRSSQLIPSITVCSPIVAHES